jgi:hypothetical protein
MRGSDSSPAMHFYLWPRKLGNAGKVPDTEAIQNLSAGDFAYPTA